MVKILKTNSGYFVAFKDDVTLTPDEICSYKAETYDDANIAGYYEFIESYPKADNNLTRRLHKELQIYKPQAQAFSNELADNTKHKQHIQEAAKKSGRIPLFVDYTIKTDNLPSGIQNSNIAILRQEEFYFPKYDAKQKRYICQTDKGIEIDLNKQRAAFNFKKNQIIINDKVFFFTAQDQQTIKNIQALKGRSDIKEEIAKLSPQQIALYTFYSDIKKSYLDDKQKRYSITHECKHALTKSKINQRKSKDNYTELSPTNIYLFGEDDEKAAHLQETYKGIANYYKNGEDLSFFPKKCQWLVDKLQPLSKEQRLELLCNEDFIVNGNIENWNRIYAPAYNKSDDQLARQAIDHGYDAPALRIEQNNEEYLERRSIAYTIDVYDPRTGNSQRKDLSRFIKNPSVVPTHNQKLIDMAELNIKARQRDLQKEGITPDLINSLLNGTYQEPFKTNTHTFDLMKQQLLKQGITLKSKNIKGEEIELKARKQQIGQHRNCITLTVNKKNQPMFSFVLDEDSKEYKCYNYRTNKKYGNQKTSQYPELPPEVKKLIKGYLNEVSNEVGKQAAFRCNGNNGNVK